MTAHPSMRLSLLAATLLAGGAASAQPASVFTTDPFQCFRMSGAPPDNLTTVAVDGQPFSQAWRVKSVSAANAWDIRIRCFDVAAVSQGDTLLATFWMRTVSAQSGTGVTALVVEKGTSPWTKSVQWNTGAGRDWRKVEVPFTMLEGYPAGTATTSSGSYNISFWLAFGAQEIEIGGLAVVNYGQNVPFESLGLTTWPYEGREPDAPWRQAAAERIDKVRKADLAVVVRDDQGNPVGNAAVHVKMKRHAFGFGTAVAGEHLRTNRTYADAVKRLFNAAVTENELKWPIWEGTGRATAEYALDWLARNGITVVRGHTLIWPGRANLPADVVAMIDRGEGEALRARINSHIAEIMAATRGKLTEWDVLNEPVTSRDVQALLGDQEMAGWFRKAREADPTVKLYVNEVDVTEVRGYDMQRQNGFYQIVKGLLDAGAPLDGIGLQSHFHMDLTPPTRVFEILERFAQFGKDLAVTEFDVNISDEQLQADYLRDYLTTTFSHPTVNSFLVWGFWEGRMWRSQGAMIRLDWSAKPAHEVWRRLVFQEWWTDVEGATDGDGIFRTRGFLGDYDVDVTVAGQARTFPLVVTSGQPNQVLVGKQTPGRITAAGVVNAASFAGGAVAPGEIIEVWGEGFGPRDLARGAYDYRGRLATFAGGTRVFFDGVPAPLVHALPGRVSAVVPYSVAASTRIQVEHLGAKTDAITLPVASAAPGIFCYSGGRGQAVAVNNYPDGSAAFNNQERAAEKGAILTFFLTGEGQTTPAGIDGKLPVYPANPRPTQAVKITFGGVESTCAENWIGQVHAGVAQVNACIPANAPSGISVPVVVTVGGLASQPVVTVAIR